jgi:hypothetical protein
LTHSMAPSLILKKRLGTTSLGKLGILSMSKCGVDLEPLGLRLRRELSRTSELMVRPDLQTGELKG